jgi:hypothetical protein
VYSSVLLETRAVAAAMVVVAIALLAPQLMAIVAAPAIVLTFYLLGSNAVVKRKACLSNRWLSAVAQTCYQLSVFLLCLPGCVVW